MVMRLDAPCSLWQAYQELLVVRFIGCFIMGFNPDEPRDSNGRWGRMNSTSRAKLTASAQFKTKMSGGKSIGRAPSKVQGDEQIFIKDNKTGRSFPVFKYEESKHAVAVTTAKALNKDFHNARDKANKDAMHAALAKTKVAITKLPAGPKPKYGPKGKMK